MPKPSSRGVLVGILALVPLLVIAATIALWPVIRDATREDPSQRAISGPSVDHLPIPPSSSATTGTDEQATTLTWTPQPSTVYPVKVIPYNHFTVGYDEAAKSPAWVAYHLEGPITFLGRADRPATFQTEFRTTAHVSHGDYTGSGFD